jgi:hypothetical protein
MCVRKLASPHYAQANVRISDIRSVSHLIIFDFFVFLLNMHYIYDNKSVLSKLLVAFYFNLSQLKS